MKKIILFLSIVALSGCFGSPPAHKSGKENKPLPNFSLLLTDSITWLHSKDIPSSNPFVLLYFSPDCQYCKSQTRDIIENMDDVKNINFYYITNYPLASARKFIKEFQLQRFPNVTVALDSALTVIDYYQVTGFPYLAIYGKDKLLNQTFIGKIFAKQIKEASED